MVTDIPRRSTIPVVVGTPAAIPARSIHILYRGVVQHRRQIFIGWCCYYDRFRANESFIS
jgi:hypothetical protein